MADMREAKREACRRILESESSMASSVFMAVCELLGNGIRAWESESIRLVLERVHGIVMPELHYEKLQAMLTASIQPTLLWEINAFENTMACIAGVPMLVDIVQELHPVDLAWGVSEILAFLRMWIQEIQTTDTAEDLFDREPRAYTALMLYKEGFVLAPPALEFAQPELDRLMRDHSLRDRVAPRWAELKLKSITELMAYEFGDSDEDVQLAHLAGISINAHTRHKQLTEELVSLIS